MNVIPYPRMPEVSKDSSGVKHTQYFNILSKVAADIETPVRPNARMASCVVYKNDVIAFGVNEMKTHPFQAKFGKNSEAVFLHAETSAIKNALKYVSVETLEKCTLYVCRIKHFDFTKKKLIFGTAKPCCGCLRCINTFNLKKVVYSLDNQSYHLLERKMK